LHSFPEGKIAQDDQPIRRLKWGTASLIVRAPVTPIVLPIVHSGFEKVCINLYISCMSTFFASSSFSFQIKSYLPLSGI
jgi:1-acyl-sn-glycerol-3-phosphate acyltransferase